MFRLSMSLCGCVLVLVFSGCGSTSGDSPRVRLSGQVTLDGQPLESGRVSFSPVDGTGQSTGSPIAAGQFSAEVSPGKMRVEIVSPKVTGTRKAYDTPDSPLIDVTKEQIPSRYNTKSQLVVDVIAGQSLDTLKYELTTAKQ